MTGRRAGVLTTRRAAAAQSAFDRGCLASAPVRGVVRLLDGLANGWRPAFEWLKVDLTWYVASW
jgi:hypothetical protein